MKNERLPSLKGLPLSEKEREEFLLEEISVLSALDSFSTNEQLVREYISNKFAEMGLEASTDKKGNLWFISDGAEGDILLCAHMDKVGPGEKLRNEGGRIIGRLDDSIGLGVILSVLKDGLRPSALFTVEEEEEIQTIQADGSILVSKRKLPEGIHNAGARFATDKLFDRQPLRPKLVLVIDVSKTGQPGNGPFVYLSYATPDGHYFRNPSETSKDLHRILHQAGLKIQYLDGGVNDGVEFTWLAQIGSGISSIGIPTENIHSAQAMAFLSDIKETVQVVETIIKKREELSQEVDPPVHTDKKKVIDV